MTGFNLKPQGNTNTSNNNAPKVDWNAINNQVETDNHTAIISQIVDLGIHTPPLSASVEKSTTVSTLAEAEALVAQAQGMLKASEFEKVKITEVNGEYLVGVQIRQPKDRQEIAVFADLPGTIVDYGSAVGKKPFRTCLNKSYKGEIRGLGLAVVPPQKQGGVWTFAPNSMLTELAKVTKQTTITDGTSKTDTNNIGLILGKSLMVDIQKTVDGDKVYVNVKGISSVPNALAKTIDYTVVNPVGISFDNVTAELLKEAGVRGNIIKKIKEANNYQGSQMQKAIEALEAEFRSGSSEQQEAPKQPTQQPVDKTNADLDDDIPF